MTERSDAARVALLGAVTLLGALMWLLVWPETSRPGPFSRRAYVIVATWLLVCAVAGVLLWQ